MACARTLSFWNRAVEPAALAHWRSGHSSGEQNWRQKTAVLKFWLGLWPLDVHTWQPGKRLIIEPYSPVMVGWVASSVHVADSHGSSLEAKMLQGHFCLNCPPHDQSSSNKFILPFCNCKMERLDLWLRNVLTSKSTLLFCFVICIVPVFAWLYGFRFCISYYYSIAIFL